MKNAVTYCRVSSVEQVEGTSLSTQEQVCTAYAQRLGCRLVKTFVDRGESAKTADRPAFIEMVEYCNRNDVSAVIVYKLDRFARNSYDFAMYQAVLAKVGVEILSATEPVTDSPAGKLMQTILAGIAQFDNEVRAERSRSGMQSIAERGGWTSRAPWGTSIERRHGVPVLQPDANAEVIHDLFTRIAAGVMNPSNARTWLQSRTGRPWATQTVWKMLRQHGYAGMICNALTKGVVINAAFDGIVDPDVFWRVQSRLSGKPDPVTGSKYKFLLHGVIQCECGRNIYASLSRSKSGKRYAYYHCRCGLRVPAVSAERHLLRALKRHGKTMAAILALLRVHIASVWQQAQAEAIVEQESCRKQLEKIDRHTEQLLNLLLDEKIRQEVYESKMKEIDFQRVRLRCMLHDSALDEIDVDAVMNTADHMLKGLDSLLLNAPVELRPGLMRCLFGGKLTMDAKGNVSNTHKTGLINTLEADQTPAATMAPPRGVVENTVLNVIRDVCAFVQLAAAA